MWVQLVIALVIVAIGYALASKPPSPKPSSIKDLDVPTAEEGRPIPIVFGTVTVTGPNVIWYGDLGTSKIKKSSK
jgi:hypothetical protein